MTGGRAWARTANPTLAAVLEAEAEPREEYEETSAERVYAVLDRNACQIKLGWTTLDPQYRLRQLRQDRPKHTLELLGTMRGGYNLERAMHGRFKPFLVEGREWYSSEIIGELAPLLDAA